MSFRIATLENNLSNLSIDSTGYINTGLPGQVKILSGKTFPGVVKSFEVLLNDFKKEFGFLDEVLAALLKGTLKIDNEVERVRALNVAKNYVRNFGLIYRSSNGNTAKAKLNAIVKLWDECEELTEKNYPDALKGLSWKFTWKNLWKDVVKPVAAVGAVVAGTVLSGGTLLAGLGVAGAGAVSSLIKNPNQNIGQAIAATLPAAASQIPGIPIFQGFNPFAFTPTLPDLANNPLAAAVVNTVNSVKTTIKNNPNLASVAGVAGALATGILKNSDVDISIKRDGLNLNYSKDAGKKATYSAGITNDPGTSLFMNINPIWLIAGGLGLFLILKK